MSTTITVLHVQGHRPEAVEDALTTIFAREERPRILRIEGTYSAVLARATDSDFEAGYRYLVLRPHAPSAWTPVLELGNRTDGLDVELSRALDGAAVFTTYVYGEVVSGYRLARNGLLVDRYTSDPTYGAEEIDDTVAGAAAIEQARGQPELFADLLPSGTSAEDFARIVLRPGWWEAHEDGTGDEEDDDLVDEPDRMRCIGLALELWAPDDYPFAQEPEDIPNAVAGPAIALAFA